MSGPACAYLVSRYPGITHQFIVSEVADLRGTGVRVETASIRRVPEKDLLSERDRTEAARTYGLLPASPVRLLRAHAHALLRSPAAYAGTLRRSLAQAPEGGRARRWRLFYFGESMLLWSWMRRKGVHHVHVHHGNVSADVALLACHYANRSGARRRWTWSLTLHGPTELLDVPGHKLPAKVADAAALMCTSDWSRSQVLSFCAPEDRDRVHVARCGIDVDGFAPPAQGRRTGTEGIEILIVAALSRRKGHAVLLDAFAQLRAAGADARLLIAGDGAERASLEEQAARLELGDAVEFLGAVAYDRVPGLYARADVFCLPSFAEGVPTVLMEAMATELPVVSTAIMGTPELVEHERSGLLVAPARADLLAGALQRLVEQPELRARLGEAARRRVLEHYSSRIAVERLRELLLPLL
jgi:glycosyltransferase involved in cell wall biosynthesis